MQEQAETWVHSATQFVEDEDTDYSACRYVVCNQWVVFEMTPNMELQSEGVSMHRLCMHD
jgi:hypothetical protein